MKTKMPENATEKMDNFFRLEEMYDSMTESITNIDKIVAEQTEFCSVLEHVATENDFTNFIKSVREQTTKTADQKDILVARQEALKKVLEACKDDEKVKASILDFIFAFGVFA